MSIAQIKNSFVDPTATSIGLSQMFSVSTAPGNPTYLVLALLDRNEYTTASTGTTGTLSGNGHTLKLSSLGSDARGAGIVFTYQSSTGQYYNSTYGYLDQLTYNSSGSADDVTTLSLFGTSNISLADAYANNAYDMMQVDPSGYLGTATVVTQPGYTLTVPAQATPDLIAATADKFVGDAWNMDGCWVLASTIAAESGASLPVQSTLIGLPGQANGEWIVAFNGPAGQTGNWEQMVQAGEMVVIGTSGGGGHITTCVSGSGATAMLVDNITYVNGSGQIQNSANDGSSSDIIVSAPHIASQEWSGVQAATVVIYELDTPVVTDTVATDTLAARASQVLGTLFAATDPAGKAITEWQVYDTATTDSLTMGGGTYQDHSAAAALTATSLAAVDLIAGTTTTADTLDVRAYNGSYWGDWQSLTVAVGGTVASAPVLENQTASQTWKGGTAITLTIPTVTFQDPQNENLTCTATLSGGGLLPAWLTFNPATDTFSGTAPNAAQTLSLTVTATDTSRLSVTDSFTATVLGAPAVTAQTANQTWTEGQAVSLTLAANTFTDPQGEQLAYTAKLSGGQSLPTWLSFNAANETFTGTAPATATTLSITVSATDSGGMVGSETFSAAVQAPAAPKLTPPKPDVTVAVPTPNQTWTAGSTVDLVLPSSTFSDALGLKMTFVAYQVSGPSVESWLHFAPATDTLSGTVPTTASGTVGLGVLAYDQSGMFATDLFSVTLAPVPGHGVAGMVSGIGTVGSWQELAPPSLLPGFHG